MTAGRERSAGRASLSVAARDRVSLRAGGRTDGSDRDSSATYPAMAGTVDDLDAFEAAIVFAMREAAGQLRARLTLGRSGPCLRES